MKTRIFFLIFVLLVVAFLNAEGRNALLIANGRYEKFSSLSTPIQEALDLKRELESIGFDVVLIQNASKENIEKTLEIFAQKVAKSKGVAFFHYGGHAVQYNGENYIIPSNADVPEEQRITSRCVNLNEVMYSMKGDTNVVILDACRNNPIKTSQRSSSRGLQISKVKPKNSIIVYAAEAGEIARDGVFTPILIQHLKDKKEFTDVLRDVRKSVFTATDGMQIPGQYDQLLTELYLGNQSLDWKTTEDIKNDNKVKQILSESVSNDKFEFNIYGITLGKTTVAQLQSMGMKVDYSSYYSRHESKKNKVQFYCDGASKKCNEILFDKDGMVSYPKSWIDAGYDVRYSYNEWINFLKEKGYSVNEDVQVYSWGEISGKVRATIYDSDNRNIVIELTLDKNFGSGMTPSKIKNEKNIISEFAVYILD